MAEAFRLERIDPLSSFVETDVRRAEGTPLYDGGVTDADGVVGRIARSSPSRRAASRSLP